MPGCSARSALPNSVHRRTEGGPGGRSGSQFLLTQRSPQLSCYHTHSIALKFTIDKRPDLGYGCACYLEQSRDQAASLTPLDSALPRHLAFCTILVQISPLQSALTDTPPATPLESALTKKTGEGGVSACSGPMCLCVPACPDLVGVANPMFSAACSLSYLSLRSFPRSHPLFSAT